MAKKAYIGVDGVARKVKKGYVGVENFNLRELPSGYTQVEYIESSGTQYIDTGFKPSSQDIEVVCDFEYTASPSGKSLFGAESSGNFPITMYSKTATTAETYVGTTYDVTSHTVTTNKRYSVDCHANNGIFESILNGEAKNATYTGSLLKSLNLFLFTNNGLTSTQLISARVYSFQIYDNGALVRDFVPCKNSSGAVGLYDVVNDLFYQNAGSGIFTAGSTRASLARKIKKAYIGIGGVARPCWSGGELAYYGTVTPLKVSTKNLAATTVGDYALFGGGSGSDGTVNAYNKSLVRTNPTSLTGDQYSSAATSVGNYALFGGGYTGSAPVKHVCAYNKSLSRTTPDSFNTAVYSLAATAVGDYALFGGGYTEYNNVTWTITAYNNNLTKSNPETMFSSCCRLAATTVGDYALFGGGDLGSNVSSIDTVTAFDKSLTTTRPTVLSIGRTRLSAATVGDYALFGGGCDKNVNIRKEVDAYDKSLTKVSVSDLSAQSRDLAATTVGDYALFGGGRNSSSIDVVNIYDSSLTRTAITPLNTKRYNLAATTVGDYALFGGGYADSLSSAISTVDAYIVT